MQVRWRAETSVARFPAGDHAEQVLIQEDTCLPFDDDIPFAMAAVLFDAVGTP